MKKTLLVLLTVFMVLTLSVSCSSDVQDLLGSLSFDLSSSKLVSTEVMDINPSSLTWYISAHRADGGFWKTGETLDDIELTETLKADDLKGETFKVKLEFGEKGTFSTGKWNIAIQGRFVDLDKSINVVVYQSDVQTVTVEANDTKTISFGVTNVLEKGKVVLKDIYADFGTESKYENKQVDVKVLLKNGDTLATDAAVSIKNVGDKYRATFFDSTLEESRSFDTALEDGLYELTFKVFPKGTNSEPLFSGKISLAIYHGFTVTVTGDLTNLEETGSVIVEQNVAKVTNGDELKFYTSLEKAFENAVAGSTIELLTDVKLTKVIEIKNSCTLDLSYYKITSDDSNSAYLKITNGAEVNVKGSGLSSIDNVIINGCGVTQKSGKITSVDCQKGHYDLEGGEVATIKVAKDQNVKLVGGKVTTKVEAAVGAKIELGNVGISDDVKKASTIKDATVTFTPGAAPEDVVKEYAVAQIGNNYYQSLADAIAAVEDNKTIYILKDTEAKGLSVNTGKTFTVDFGGHTYTVNKPGAGSDGTTTQGFQLLEGNTITFKNGKIAVAEANKTCTWAKDATEKGIAMVIQNYCNLTLDKMIIDGTNMSRNGGDAVRYTISNNSGTVEIIDSQIIAMTNDDFAFDSCKYGNYSKPTVKVSGSSVIDGKVELSGGDVVLTASTVVNGQVRVGENKEKDAATGSTLTVKEGAKISNPNGYAVIVFGSNTADISGIVEGMVGTNGNAYNAGSTINIKDGASITKEDDVAMYIPNGTLNITGGTITGTTAVYFKSTILNISGGTFVGTGEDRTYEFNNNGCDATGNALVIDNCNYPSGINNPIITGGIFTSTKAAAVGSYAGNGQVTPLSKFIAGGTYSSDPTSLLADGYKATETAGQWVVSLAN